MGSASGSQRSSHSSNSVSSKLNITATLSISPRATPVANISAPALPALNAPIPSSSSFSAPRIAVLAPAFTEELFKLFMQTYMDTIKNKDWLQSKLWRPKDE